MSADRIKTLLLSTKRQGMEALIDHMEENGFFTAPCSTSHHLSKEGGLAEHSYNVYCVAKDLSFLMMDGVTDISKEVSDGTYKKEKVPNISNLQEIVFKVLEGKVE